jgi:hypothetical protein
LTVLSVLKIIGLVLLAVLGVLLLLALLVLLVPINYRANGYSRSAKKGCEQRVTARAGWLFGLLRARYVYPEKPYLVVKLFVFTLYNAQRKAEKEAKKAEKERKKQEKKAAKAPVSLTEEVNHAEEPETAAPAADTGATAEESEESGESPKKNPFVSLYEKITRVIQNINYTSKRIYGKINNNDIARYLEIIQSARFQRAFAKCRRELGRIWRSVRPRKIRAAALLGTDDPALTGQILEVYCLLYPLIGRNVRVAPSFERAALTGDFMVAGHITAPKLLWAAWRLYKDKNIRAVLGQFAAVREEAKQETEEEEG